MRNKGGNGQVIEAIREHISIEEYMLKRGYTFKRISNELYCKELSGFCVNPMRRQFYDHKNEKGGSIIDLVMLLEGKSLPEAISSLRLELQGYSTPITNTVRYTELTKDAEPKEFVLPKAAEGKYSRVFAYLSKTRGLENRVISDMMSRKMLYQEAQYHNCVFVGYDYDNEPKYASLRSTGSKKFMIDVEGSIKKIGWFVDNRSKSLFVSEAPIDSMSLMSLLLLGGKDYSKYNYLAQGGAGNLKSLEYHLKHNPETNKIYLAYDNDEAGQKATQRATALLKSLGYAGQIIVKLPISKDFNDDLQQHRASTPQKNIQQAKTQVPTYKTEETICII